jgi:hypothetical protein
VKFRTQKYEASLNEKIFIIMHEKGIFPSANASCLRRETLLQHWLLCLLPFFDNYS